MFGAQTFSCSNSIEKRSLKKIIYYSIVQKQIRMHTVALVDKDEPKTNVFPTKNRKKEVQQALSMKTENQRTSGGFLIQMYTEKRTTIYGYKVKANWPFIYGNENFEPLENFKFGQILEKRADRRKQLSSLYLTS